MTLLPIKSEHFKTTIYILMFVGSVTSAALFADDRYAHAREVASYFAETKKDVKEIARVVRKQLLEDKIFELDLIPENKRTQVQRALLNRYKTQLQTLGEQ